MTMPPGLGDDVGGGCWSVFPLLTDRLRLRPLRGDDAPRIRACVSNSAVATRTLHIPHPLPDGAESLFLHDVIEERAAGRSVVCAIEQREGGVLIGVCGLSNLDWSAGTGEVGYWLAEEAWGLGYASEALAALLAHAFDDLKLSRVHAHVLADNAASVRVLERAGFRLLKTETRTLDARGGKCVVRMMEIAARDFETARAARLKMVLVSAVALVDADNRVLLAQRPEGKSMAGLWEFPGGKVDPGETPERALIRELDEELGIDVSGSCLAPLTFASHGYADFHLLMPLYVCRQWRGKPHPREGQKLAWVRANQLRDYPMPPADIPLIPILQDWL